MASEQNKLRLFLAIELPGTLQAQLAGLHHKRDDVRWLNPRQYHITVYFLGEVDTEQANQFILIAKDAVKGITEIPLKLSRLSVMRDKMIWACIDDPTRQLSELFQRIKKKAMSRSLGHLKQHAEISPHVLLGKSTGSNLLSEDDAAFLHMKNNFHVTEFKAHSLALFESQLDPNGAKHNKMMEIRFGRAEDEPPIQLREVDVAE